MSRRRKSPTEINGESVPSIGAENNSPQVSGRIAALVLAIVISIVYAGSLDVPLFFDDTPSIINNPSITSVWPLIGTADQPGPLQPPLDLSTSGRPLANLSFALNYAFGGLNPLGYHIVNIAFHFANALLLWAIVRRTLLLPYFAGRFAATASWFALAVALLWALHPLQTETVTYVTQRTELMVVFFYLATFYCSLRYWAAGPFPPGEGRSEGALVTNCDATSDLERTTTFGNRSDDRNAWLFLAIVACLAGMASKEIMVSAPLMVLLFDRLFVSGSLLPAIRRSWPLYFGLAATWLLLVFLNINSPRSSSAGFHTGIPIQFWWYTQCQILFKYYLKLAIWPAPLLLHYEFPYLETFDQAWPYVALVLLCAALTIFLLVRNTIVGFLLTFMAAVLAPTSIVPIPTEMAAERRMYLPLAALIVIAVVGGYMWVLQRRQLQSAQAAASTSRRTLMPALLTFAAVLLACGIASTNRVAEYHDEIGLWQQIVRHQPENYIAHHNLSIALKRAGRQAESRAELEAALAVRPEYVPARSDLGFELLQEEKLPEALQTFEQALSYEPNHVAALDNYGIALIEAGRYPEAIDVLQHAFQLEPKNIEVRNNLARVLTLSGHPDQSLELLQPALELAPNHPDVYFNLGNALAAQGNLPAAIQLLEHSLELKPDFAGAHNSLAIALNQSGDVAGARRHFERFLELRPKNPGALCNLANVVALQGDYKQAAALYRRAVDVQPNSAEAHYSLGTALAQTGELPDAIEHFEKALELKPNLLIAYSNLADALLAAHRDADAIQTAQKGLAIAKASADQAATTQLEDWLKQHQPPK